MITQHRLREVFDYNPNNGRLVSRVTRGVRVAGKEVGTLNKRWGYLYVWLDGKFHSAHKLVWLWHTGTWPTEDIDHINGDRADNRIENLRVVDRSFNLLGRTGYKNNSTGTRGVHRMASGRYHAHIGLNGKRGNIGYFGTLEEAVAARESMYLKHKAI